MWLLNFLLNVYNFVIDWFGTNYVRWRNDINNLPNTITGLLASIQNYYRLAVNGISAYVTAFYNNYIAPDLNLLYGLLNETRALAVQAYNSIANVANIVGNAANYIKAELVSYFHNLYDSVISGLHSLVYKIINQDIPRLFGYINMLLPFQSWISQAASLLDITKIKKIVDNWDRTINGMIIFLSNPLGFILGLFWQFAIVFLAYVIGYALGAAKEDLPPIPNWNNLARK